MKNMCCRICKICFALNTKTFQSVPIKLQLSTTLTHRRRKRPDFITLITISAHESLHTRVMMCTRPFLHFLSGYVFMEKDLRLNVYITTGMSGPVLLSLSLSPSL